MIPNLTKIRSNGAQPRIHGNGFIQLDLTEMSRLHIWGHPDIPKQKVPVPIHNHRFSFRSTVLVGRMINVIYDFERHDNIYDFEYHSYFKPTFTEYEAVCRQDEDTILTATNNHGTISKRQIDLIDSRSSNNSYVMFLGEYHEMVPCIPSATFCTKIKTRPSYVPKVLVPYGEQPDNSFDRYDSMDSNEIWDIIHDVMERQIA